MLILLGGYSGTGKSTVARLLENYYGYHRVPICTTRPKRDKESSDEYIFVTDKIFDVLIENNFLIEHTEYMASYGNVKYGTLRCLVEPTINDTKNIYVLIVNPQSHQFYTSNYDRNMILSFVLTANENVLHQRLKIRGDSDEEICRRLEADKKDFANISKSTYTEINTDNTKKDDIPKLIREIIDRRHKNPGV